MIILYFVLVRDLLRDIKSFWEICIPETRKCINPRYFISIFDCGMVVSGAKDMTVLRRDFLTCFMEKMRFQQKPSLFLFFIVPQFHVKTLWNWRNCFLIILASKMKLADGFMILRGINYETAKVGREKKWNWRHAAAPRPSVSFFSRPILDGFIILAP